MVVVARIACARTPTQCDCRVQHEPVSSHVGMPAVVARATLGAAGFAEHVAGIHIAQVMDGPQAGSQ